MFRGRRLTFPQIFDKIVAISESIMIGYGQID